jgi:hypothetical protein
MPTITDDFEDDSPESDLIHRVERLQGIVCHLLSRNEELRKEVRELELLGVWTGTRGDEQR